MFSKFTVFVSVLAIGAASANAASTKPVVSADFFFKPYVGADYQFNKYGNKDQPLFGAGVQSDDISDISLNGGNIHVGARIHKNMGVELGYFQTETAKKTNSALFVGETETDAKGATLDLLGYYPVSKELELIGTVGVSYAKMTLGGSAVTAVSDEEEIKPRIGAGAQYWLTDNINTRGLVRYQGADFDDNVSDAVFATVGLNYQF